MGAGTAPVVGAAVGKSAGAGTYAEAPIVVDAAVGGAAGEVRVEVRAEVRGADEVALAGTLRCKNAIQSLYKASASERL